MISWELEKLVQMMEVFARVAVHHKQLMGALSRYGAGKGVHCCQHSPFKFVIRKRVKYAYMCEYGYSEIF